MTADFVTLSVVTTGEDASRARIWDTAVIDTDGREYRWHTELPLWATEQNTWHDEIWVPAGESLGLPIHSGADPNEPMAERDRPYVDEWTAQHGHLDTYSHATALPEAESIERLVDLTEGKTIVCVNPVKQFEAIALAYLADYAGAPWAASTIHDVRTAALVAATTRAGREGKRAPRPGASLRLLSELLDVDAPVNGVQYSSIGEARWARALWQASLKHAPTWP